MAGSAAFAGVGWFVCCWDVVLVLWTLVGGCLLLIYIWVDASWCLVCLLFPVGGFVAGVGLVINSVCVY